MPGPWAGRQSGRERRKWRICLTLFLAGTKISGPNRAGRDARPVFFCHRMRLRDFVRSDLVELDLPSHGLEDTVEALAERLRARGVLPEGAPLEDALLARERAHTTAMGSGVAVPHANVAGLQGPVLMVARSTGGASFGPPGTDPVHLFFVLLSPPDHASAHIKLLARITRLLRHPGFVDELIAARSRDEILGMIARVDAQHL